MSLLKVQWIGQLVTLFPFCLLPGCGLSNPKADASLVRTPFVIACSRLTLCTHSSSSASSTDYEGIDLVVHQMNCLRRPAKRTRANEFVASA